VMFGSATGLHPFVLLILLELPEAAHAMRGLSCLSIHLYGVIADPEVLANFTYR
jgi:hypothetical protein